MDLKYDTPSSIDLIGEEVFIKLPLYKRRYPLTPIYINPVIYEEMFGNKYDWESAAETISSYFSVTIDKSLSENEIIGYVYVDKQGDPTDVALNGNKGSGRAYYIDKYCNLKGEKTPLATSSRDDYNNGKYSLDSAIQEAIISNILSSELEPTTFQTLAVFSNNEFFNFPHTNAKLPCGTIIRYSKNKELYRFSHRFINEIPFDKNELYFIANKMGILEGNKFIDRFLHGAWSLGNISIEGNIIDLDTSFYTTGRQPQWCFTNKYKTNFFGFEQHGQSKVLETVVNSKLNIDNLKIEELDSIIESSRLHQISIRFAELNGYDENMYNKYNMEFNELSKEFIYLSQLIYDNYDNLNVLDKNCNKTYLYDFSNLFRYYELLKKKEKWTINNALNLLINNESEPLEYSMNDDSFHEKMLNNFSNIIVENNDQFYDSINKCISFIEKLDLLNEKIKLENDIDINKKLIWSYYTNETRTYLTALEWIRSELIYLYDKFGSKKTNYYIQTIINFNKRNIIQDFYKCDLKLFEEGLFYTIIKPNGYYQFVFEFYELNLFEKIDIIINGVKYYSNQYEKNIYKSSELSIDRIDHISSFELYIDNKKIELNPIGRKTKMEIFNNNLIK